ncbi:MAG: hypothetical protein HY007_04520 [Candidatus Sungbacteria bacterium]|nr:hypothetical protein [Candidatus Sungbacteria bacterium]
MFIDILLGIIFVGSSFTLWYRISEKIPYVVAIHDEVITQRLHENSARFRIFLLHVKTFYKEEYYRNLFWNFLGKIVYKLHIMVLRIDNALLGFLKKIRARDGLAGLSIGEQEMDRQVATEKIAVAEKNTDNYWSTLKNEQSIQSRTPRKRHVEGVRTRARKISIKPDAHA